MPGMRIFNLGHSCKPQRSWSPVRRLLTIVPNNMMTVSPPRLQKSPVRRSFAGYRATLAAACAALLLGGCGLFGSKPLHEPTPLTPVTTAMHVNQVWTSSVGKSGSYDFQPVAVGDNIFAAGENGEIVRIDAVTGNTVWTAKAGTHITAGPGSDGEVTVVGTLKGDVLAFDHDGKPLWKANAGSEVLTAPLVGHGVVITRAVNNRVTAFDEQTGKIRWIYQQPNVSLSLRTGTGMIFLGEQAVVTGFPGGKVVALDLTSGNVRWMTTLAYPHGVTEVERVNDVTGSPALFGRQLCAATFQGRLGCMDAVTGNGLWANDFSTASGVSQDEKVVASTNTDSQVYAFDAADGSVLWHNDALRWRSVSAPLALGSTVVVGDYQGYVHFLARDTGKFLARMKTDGSAITAQPVIAGQTLVIQTRKGGLFAYRPE